MQTDERDRLIRLETHFSAMERDMAQMRADSHEMRNDLKLIREQATKWKSGLAALLAIGSLGGWIVATFKDALFK